MSQREWSPREWSRWDASDMDGQTRKGEAFGLKPNQAVRHGREARRVVSREENIISHGGVSWQAR
jgi:hypothetical protein